MVRLGRELERKAALLGVAVRKALSETLDKATRIQRQTAQRKVIPGQPKLYAWHAPEAECINKGKARQPYDGHTLREQLEQTGILIQDITTPPEQVFVDLGYRGADADNPAARIIHRGKHKRLSAQEKKQLRRRQAIEPIIGHLKSDHRMNRCPLKGEMGDCLHAVLCAAGYNIRWLLQMNAKNGISFLRDLFLRLCCSAWVTRWRQLTASAAHPSDYGARNLRHYGLALG